MFIITDSNERLNINYIEKWQPIEDKLIVIWFCDHPETKSFSSKSERDAFINYLDENFLLGPPDDLGLCDKPINYN